MFQLLRQMHPKVVQYAKYLSTPVRMAGMDEVDVSIAVQSETMRYINEGYPLKIIYPVDGTAYMLTGTGILKNAPQGAAARNFADWLLGDEAQLVLQRNNFYFVPVNPAALAYKTFAGKNIVLFTQPVDFSAQQRHEAYVHRIGRTGRAGKKGVAITFIEPKEYRQLRLIERLARTKIVRRELPSSADILERQQDLVKEQLIKTLENNHYADYHTIISDVAAEGGYDMSREDLIGTNAKIVKSVVDQALKYSPDAIFVIISNPMDAMTYLTLKDSKLPRERVIGQGGMLCVDTHFQIFLRAGGDNLTQQFSKFCSMHTFAIHDNGSVIAVVSFESSGEDSRINGYGQLLETARLVLINARKKLERDMYRSISSSDGIIITDKNNRIIFANLAAVRIYKVLGAANLIGCHLFDRQLTMI